jgi:hypothetical protein
MMTVPLDLGLTTGVGMAFSMAAEELLQEMDKESMLKSKPFRVGMIFNTIVGVGIAAWCYKLAPDWMLMYYADHRRLPKSVQVGMFGLYQLTYTFGFLLAPQLSRMKKDLDKKAFAGVLAYEVAYILLSMKRLLNVGTTQEFEEGNAQSIFNTPLARILGPGIPFAIPALFYTAKKAGVKAGVSP